MKKIVTSLKTWHFEMVPKYSFDYFLQRCQVLGGQKHLVVLEIIYRLICPKLEEFIKDKINGKM